MIDPTREEWLEALKRANVARRVSVAPTHAIIEAALGPCPPEPAPEPFLKDAYTLVEQGAGAWAGRVYARELALTPDEADAMADALCAHAHHARGQKPTREANPTRDAPVGGPLIICGRLAAMICQRPKGHDGACDAFVQEGSGV